MYDQVLFARTQWIFMLVSTKAGGQGEEFWCQSLPQHVYLSVHGGNNFPSPSFLTVEDCCASFLKTAVFYCHLTQDSKPNSYKAPGIGVHCFTGACQVTFKVPVEGPQKVTFLEPDPCIQPSSFPGLGPSAPNCPQSQNNSAELDLSDIWKDCRNPLAERSLAACLKPRPNRWAVPMQGAWHLLDKVMHRA